MRPLLTQLSDSDHDHCGEVSIASLASQPRRRRSTTQDHALRSDRLVDLEMLLHYVQVPQHKVSEFAAVNERDWMDPSGTLFRHNKVEKRAEQLRSSFDIFAKFSFYAESVGLMQGKSLLKLDEKLLSTIQDAEDTCWLDVCAPSEQDIMLLSKIFRLHPLTTEDIMQSDEAREKFETFDHYSFLCTRTLTNDLSSPTYLTESFYFILIFAQCVVSVRPVPVEHPRQVLIKLIRTCSSAAHAEVNFSPDWIAYAILDEVVDSIRPLIKAIEYDVDCIDDLILILHMNEKGDMLRRIRNATKKVIQLLRLLQLKGDLFKLLVHRCSDYFQADMEQYLMDICDHVEAMRETLQMTFETLHNAHNIYLSGINVELSQASNESNVIVKQLSIMSAICLPMTVVTGLFGMNVTVPGQDGGFEHSHSSFWVIFGSMILLALAPIAVGKRYGYM